MAPVEREKCRPPRVTRGDVEAAEKKEDARRGREPKTGDARRGWEPKTGEDTGAGVKMKTQDEETRRMGRSAGEVGLDAVTEEGGPVTDKGFPDESLGEDVGNVPRGGDGAEQDGEAKRAPDQHRVARGHPAGVLSDFSAAIPSATDWESV